MTVTVKIQEALQLLDAKEDGHWTNDGLPRVGIVEALSGIKPLTRGQITEAAPAFTRANPSIAVDPLPTPDSQEEQESFLLGSSVQPAVFELKGGEVVPLGAVVAQAHALSGLSVKEFNALPEEEAEALIAAVVAELDLKEPESELQPAAPAKPVEPEPLSEMEQAMVKLAAAQEKLAAAQEITARAQRDEAAAQWEVDAIIEANTVLNTPRRQQEEIMFYLQGQQRLREQRAAQAPKPVVQRAPIDQSMARKTGYGHQRPQYGVISKE